MRGRSWLDVVAAVAVGLLLAASLCAEPAWRALDPQVDVELRFWFDAKGSGEGFFPPTDPWGTPWVTHRPFLYSCGPDGVDQVGRGDDVSLPVFMGDAAVLADAVGPLAGALALLLAVTHVVARLSAWHRQSPALAALAALAGAVLVDALCPFPNGLQGTLRGWLLVPPRLALLGGSGLPFALWALAVTLAGRGEPGTEAGGVQGS